LLVAAATTAPLRFVSASNCTAPPLQFQVQRRATAKPFAVLAYNFGNFRQEVTAHHASAGTYQRQKWNSATAILPAWHADYDFYFFTDAPESPKFAALGFHVCTVDPDSDQDLAAALAAAHTDLSHGLLETRGRVLAKWFKFGHVPPEFKAYQYVVHTDASMFGPQNDNRYVLPNPSALKGLVAAHPGVALFTCAHPMRDRIVDEVAFTELKGVEVPAGTAAWLAELRAPSNHGGVEELPLIATGLFVRKVGSDSSSDDADLDLALRNVFSTMVKYGLRRDQNVVPYMLHKFLTPSAAARSQCAFTVRFQAVEARCPSVAWPSARLPGGKSDNASSAIRSAPTTLIPPPHHRVPCSYASGQRLCDRARAVPCNHRTAFVVKTLGWQAGGPEALQQLAMALNVASAGYAFVQPGQPQWPGDETAYPSRVTKQMLPADMCPGDVLVIPEGGHSTCDLEWAAKQNVRVFMWLLGSSLQAVTPGCQYLARNNYLATSEGRSLPQNRVISPYLSPHWVKVAVERAGLNPATGDISSATSPLLSEKYPLVLVSKTAPEGIRERVKHAVKLAKGKFFLVNGSDFDGSLTEVASLAYEQAMVVFDWCVTGAHRLPLEASLLGALLVTNPCKAGANFADYPVPPDFVYAGPDDRLVRWLAPLLTRVFHDYWRLVDLFAPLRLRVLSHSAASMAHDAQGFIKYERSRRSSVEGGRAEEYFSMGALTSATAESEKASRDQLTLTQQSVVVAATLPPVCSFERNECLCPRGEVQIGSADAATWSRPVRVAERILCVQESFGAFPDVKQDANDPLGTLRPPKLCRCTQKSTAGALAVSSLDVLPLPKTLLYFPTAASVKHRGFMLCWATKVMPALHVLQRADVLLFVHAAGPYALNGTARGKWDAALEAFPNPVRGCR
jgi:hypothetical protein